MNPPYEFDMTEDTDRAVGFEPLPMGRYQVIISDAGLKETKAGDGLYLKVRFDVVTGSYAKRVLFDNFNVENPSPDARSIGRAQLKAMLLAVDVRENAQLSDEFWLKQNLIDKQLLVQVGTERQPGFDPQNKVKAFFPLGATGEMPVPQQAARAASNQVAQAAFSDGSPVPEANPTPSWQR